MANPAVLFHLEQCALAILLSLVVIVVDVLHAFAFATVCSKLGHLRAWPLCLVLTAQTLVYWYGK
jgi:hypothetical protein